MSLEERRLHEMLHGLTNMHANLANTMYEHTAQVAGQMPLIELWSFLSLWVRLCNINCPQNYQNEASREQFSHLEKEERAEVALSLQSTQVHKPTFVSWTRSGSD
eukprot:867572-Amphidinium_carterae.1